MKILIHPFSNDFNGKNAKNYPYWNNLIKKLKEKHEINQIGIKEEQIIEGVTNFYKNLNFNNLKKIVNEHDLWISIDSFLPHFCKCYNLKNGIVIWGKSNPEIFGYKENVNLLKDKKYLRENQFDIWHNEEENKDAFVDINIILNEVSNGCWNN